jgi:hypothetical protein
MARLMSLPQTIELERLADTTLGGWVVIVFDNELNTWDEVIGILMAATGCSFDEAYTETWEVDKLGSSVVHSATEDECHQVGAVIATIGIRVQVSQE